ncbi:hypothetical protein EIZ82_23045 [Escherichia coli]|nr:hypothetical protein [Escherichia coli]MQK59495.1 hypothetical protein [Escherichia coli]
MPENPASYRVVRTKSYLFNKAFQERMAEHIRYMVETIAHHQVDIDSEV